MNETLRFYVLADNVLFKEKTFKEENAHILGHF